MLAKKDSKNDRRNDIYLFHTLFELLEYYAEFLSAQQMETVIRDSAQLFVERGSASERETRLQYIKKCEQLMEALVSMKESGLRHGIVV